MSAKTYDKQTGAFLAKLAECMPALTSKEMQTWIEKPKILRAKLGGALSSPNVISLPGGMTGIWKSVQLGVSPKNVAGIRASLLAAGCGLSDRAEQIIRASAFTIAPVPVKLSLVAVTVAELGFLGQARYGHICERGIGLGLGLCPAEVGPRLRLQYLDQPKGEWLYLAMETISDSFDNPSSFTVAHMIDEGLQLNGTGGIRGVRYNPETVFVFGAPA